MSQATRITLLDEMRATHSSDRWPEFVNSYSSLLRRWLLAQRVNPSDAEDIQQETMMVVLKDIGNFRHNGRPGAFRLWLKRILANRIRQAYTRKKARKEVSTLDQLAQTLADDQTQVSAAFEREHDQFLIEELLQRAKGHFSESRVALFRELVLEGVPVETLVGKYNLTTGAIRVQQHRILKWLKSTGAGLVDF